jgi:hypothetical protein
MTIASQVGFDPLAHTFSFRVMVTNRTSKQRQSIDERGTQRQLMLGQIEIAIRTKTKQSAIAQTDRIAFNEGIKISADHKPSTLQIDVTNRVFVKITK